MGSACLRISSESKNCFVIDAYLTISDGLHLTSEGYRVVFDTLKRLILSKWAELDPETMTMPTPQSVVSLG